MTPNSNTPLLEELTPGAERLYFLFGGINQRVGMPPFEFYQSARILNEHKFFLRDFSQSWYQTGLPGIASDPFALASYLQSRIETLAPREVYFVGNSMGGFAAIMCAAIVGRGKAIAFAPQTSIGPLTRLKLGDFRWLRQLTRTYARTLRRPHCYHLAPLLQGQCEVEIYVSRLDQLDLRHAEALSGLPGVTVRHYEVGGHMLVRHLRDTGELASILGGYSSSSSSVGSKAL